MNRLKNSMVYLSGSMDRVIAGGGIQWRKDLTPFLRNRGVIVLDPTNKPKCVLGKTADESVESREKAIKLKNEGYYDEFASHYRPIRNIDLRFTDKADFLIVHLDMNEKPFGTINEISIAIQQKKPIIIHCPYGKKEVPNWIWGAVPHELFFSTWDEVKEYLRHVDEDENVDDLGRWYLFDFDENN